MTLRRLAYQARPFGRTLVLTEKSILNMLDIVCGAGLQTPDGQKAGSSYGDHVIKRHDGRTPLLYDLNKVGDLCFEALIALRCFEDLAL